MHLVRAPAERVIYVHINKPFFLHLKLSAVDYIMLYRNYGIYCLNNACKEASVFSDWKKCRPTKFLPSTGGVHHWPCVHWVSYLVAVLLICCPHRQKETRPLMSVQKYEWPENYFAIKAVAINISLNRQWFEKEKLSELYPQISAQTY